MEQATSYDTADDDPAEVGRRLGHDLYRKSISPAAQAWPASVLEGFCHAQSQHVARQRPDRYTRKWLQLRLSAYRRERVVDECITPDFLRRIDVERCPVTRVVLTHGECSDSDWSVDRLNNDGAYAANNLAVMSTRANSAKGARSYSHVFALSERPAASGGLEPVEWLRLAALMLGPCFATQPRLAPAIPLAAPIPSYSVRPAVQQIQHVFTCHAHQQSGKNALIKAFKVAAPDERALARLRAFAEAMHAGLKGLDEAHDVWLKPGLMAAFIAWRACLDERSWGLAGEVSRRLAGSNVVPESRLQSWRLETHGYRSWCHRPRRFRQADSGVGHIPMSP